jgi:hypothetical protein
MQTCIARNNLRRGDDRKPRSRALKSCSRPFHAKLLALVVSAATATVPSTLSASSCNNPIVVEIKFKSGGHCWQHKGTGTHFFGQFMKGQSISVGAAGSTSYGTRGDLSWTIHDPWQIGIEGPGGFEQFDNGVLYAKLPATGKYVISMGPCAIWGARGTVVVCASDPRLTIE